MSINITNGSYSLNSVPIGSGGSGLEGTQYVFVKADSTDTENADELLDFYATAQEMSPSITNRITIVAAPGKYNFPSNFEMNTDYIDLVSLDGNRSIVFNGAGTLFISTNDTFVKGVDVLTKQFISGTESFADITIENCKGGNGSFNTSGTYIDCEAGDNSFGYNATASGRYTNCKAGNNSFGVAFDTFVQASGTFTNCIAGDNSFGVGVNNTGQASGTFTNCRGGGNSFGGGAKGILSGKLYYCRLTTGTFQTVSDGGKTRLCLDGNDVENNQG